MVQEAAIGTRVEDERLVAQLVQSEPFSCREGVAAWNSNPETLVRQWNGAKRLALGRRGTKKRHIDLVLRQLGEQGRGGLDHQAQLHIRACPAERTDRTGHERIQ